MKQQRPLKESPVPKPALILSLQNFGVAFGDRIVLSGVNLDVPSPGVTVLMGPVGTGKSTLLRTIAGINQAAPSFRSWGEAVYASGPLRAEEPPALVAQNARLMMSSVLENIINNLPERGTLSLAQKRELAVRLLKAAGLDELTADIDQAVVDLPLALQRHLAIARTVAANPKLLCVDEPTAGLGENDSLRLLRYLKEQGERRAVIVVLHNELHARELGGQTALLAGGWVHGCAPTKRFFDAPASEVTAEFVRTGSCGLPSPNARPEDLDESVPMLRPPLPKEATRYISDVLGPRGFMWLKRGMLAGTPMPGIVADEPHDLEALQRVGVTVLVSLTETRFDPSALEPYGIRGLWLPMPDMGTPSVEHAHEMCETVFDLMAEGYVVAYHCKAGLGRTGTMLAAQLILEGSTALDALESVRRIEPRWVQSVAQVVFLEKFAGEYRSLSEKACSGST